MSADGSTALVERVRQGDAQALASYLESHRASLLAYVSRRLGDLLRSKVDPDDVVQETAIAAVQAIPNAHLADRDPFGWLCNLADQRIIDAYRRHVRSQKRSAAREARFLAAGNHSSAASFQQQLVLSMTTASMACARSEQEERLLEALQTLPAVQREALRLRFVEGLSTADVARRLDKEHGTVRVMLSRSIQKLRGLLGSDIRL